MDNLRLKISTATEIRIEAMGSASKKPALEIKSPAMTMTELAISLI
ncbi:unnamed protein product [marine sediment metagenome]|uniref:Uncharacterized protein n=1 Tax=marine sediment metagenome TaxID=412755 RepID=X1SYQ7_9ZZZZ